MGLAHRVTRDPALVSLATSHKIAYSPLQLLIVVENIKEVSTDHGAVGPTHVHFPVVVNLKTSW